MCAASRRIYHLYEICDAHEEQIAQRELQILFWTLFERRSSSAAPHVRTPHQYLLFSMRFPPRAPLHIGLYPKIRSSDINSRISRVKSRWIIARRLFMHPILNSNDSHAVFPKKFRAFKAVSRIYTQNLKLWTNDTIVRRKTSVTYVILNVCKAPPTWLNNDTCCHIWIIQDVSFFCTIFVVS